MGDNLNDGLDGGGAPGLQYVRVNAPIHVATNNQANNNSNNLNYNFLLNQLFEQNAKIRLLEKSIEAQDTKAFDDFRSTVNGQIGQIFKRLDAEKEARIQFQETVHELIKSNAQFETKQRKEFEGKVNAELNAISETTERVQSSQDELQKKIGQICKRLDAEKGERIQFQEKVQEILEIIKNNAQFETKQRKEFEKKVDAELHAISETTERVQSSQDELQKKFGGLLTEFEADREARAQLKSDIETEAKKRNHLEKQIDTKLQSISKTIQHVQGECLIQIGDVRQQFEADRLARAQFEESVRKSVKSGIEAEAAKRKKLEKEVDNKLRSISEYVRDYLK